MSLRKHFKHPGEIVCANFLYHIKYLQSTSQIDNNDNFTIEILPFIFTTEFFNFIFTSEIFNFIFFLVK
jgi:type IV secretory pathway TrbL component